MEPFINMITQKRKEAAKVGNKPMSTVYKLIGNSYGLIMSYVAFKNMINFKISNQIKVATVVWVIIFCWLNSLN